MKKLVLTIAIVLGMVMGASAQVFMLDADNSQRELSDLELNINNPDGFGQGTDYYEYAPIGSGALLLAGLAGSYLLAKKNQK